MNKQKILNELDKIFIGKGFMSCCHICPSCEKKMKKELFNLIKETKEEMAKVLRMNKRRFPATNITVFYQELREEFNLTIDSYLKEK